MSDALYALFDIRNLSALKPYKSYLASSHDREGGNYDWGNYALIDQMEGIVLDVDGPGLITRIWTADPEGQLKIYIDGNSDPIIDEPFKQFMKKSPLLWGNGYLEQELIEVNTIIEANQAMGYTSYGLIPFSNGCKLTISPPIDIYYQVNYQIYDSPHSYPSYTVDSPVQCREEYEQIRNGLHFDQFANKPDILIGDPLNRVLKQTVKLSLKAGKRGVIFEKQGAIAILSLKMTVPYSQDSNVTQHIKDNLLFRAYWDDDIPNPENGLKGKASIKAPLAYFFMDYGLYDNYSSALIRKCGAQYECRFPMPIQKQVLMVLINQSIIDLDEITIEVEYEENNNRKTAASHFKAIYHCENSTFGPDLGNYRDQVMYLQNLDASRNYIVLEAFGRGHFIGCNFYVDYSETPFPRAMFESDEWVCVDNDPTRTMRGTGNEDYINDAWGIHPVRAELSGGKDNGHSFFGYRFHISDSISFSKKINFSLEHGSGNNCSALYKSVAYYYLECLEPQDSIDGGIARSMKHYYKL